MISGRIKIFIGGLAAGVALPWNIWKVLEEAANDPEKAKLLLSVAALALLVYLVYNGFKLLLKNGS